MVRFTHQLIASAVSAIAATAVTAGPVWPELGDAGSLPSTAQSTTGAGAIKGIRGEIGGTPFAGPVDNEDMYLIYIDDHINFCAKTILLGVDCCGNAYPVTQPTNFNTQLWLFKFDGTGLLANDDDPFDPPRSKLIALADDGSGDSIPAPGLYYIAITVGPGNDPVSAGGAIFTQTLATEVSGNDGPGGATAITGWTGGGGGAQYEITFCGASFVDENAVPTLSEWGLIALAAAMMLGGALVIQRRRRVVAT